MGFRNVDISQFDLRKLYLDEKKTIRQIAKLTNTSHEFIRRQLTYQNIPKRQGSDAIKIQWLDNDYRRKLSSEIAKKYLGKKANEHPLWKGGIEINSAGYVLQYSPNHPRQHRGKVRQHILIMEKHIGRYLLKTEVVHHINGNRQDNRIENLQLMDKREHDRLSHKKAA